jgi:paraquat-inducible protein A
MGATSNHPSRTGRPSAALLLALLGLTAVLLTLGLTWDAVTIGKTITKEVLIWKLRVVDERSTYSILTAIFKLWDDGNYVLFLIVFSFSIVFPITKLLVNTGLVLAAMRPGIENAYHPRIAIVLGYLSKWSMIEVFMAAMLCVVVKMGDLVRVQIEAGLYLFCAAVIMSIVSALLTRRFLSWNEPQQTFAPAGSES